MLIFSDKTIAWQSDKDPILAWKRWAKRAIGKSVDQIRGAERWIAQFPDRIYIDRKCTQKLPIELPPIERRKVHGLVVALGAGEASKKYFKGGIGSLAINPGIAGTQHWEGPSVTPLTIGDVDPNGPFVHVLDDATLDIILSELDTITDFAQYLAKKEKFIRSGRLLFAGGEEDLLAHYMTHMNNGIEHDFTTPDGTPFPEGVSVTFEPGIYDDVRSNPQYIAKKIADRDSYLWDRLIETFTKHVLDGTSLVPDDQANDVQGHEMALRHMALVSRFKRRVMAEGIKYALAQGEKGDRYTRAFVPGPGEPDQDTAFFFMTFAIPSFALKGGYQQYRLVRANVAQAYGLALLEKHPKLRRVVGIATEPPSPRRNKGSSEDLIMLQDIVWTDTLKNDLAERKKALNIMTEGNYRERPATGSEFPDVLRARSPSSPNRKERRRQAALERAAKRNR